MSRKKNRRLRIPEVERLNELRDKQRESMNAGLVKLSQSFKSPVPSVTAMPDPDDYGIGFMPSASSLIFQPSSMWQLPMASPFSFIPSTWSQVALAPSVDTKKLNALKSAEPYKVMCRAPDYVHVITAWRAWGVTYGADGYRLKGLGVDHVWENKKQLNAECTASGRASHAAPQPKCTCGVWAFKELDSLVQAITGYGDIRVLGQVSLWGRVVETTNGYRAQYAYPSELWLLDDSLEELGLIYDVPIRIAQHST